MSSIHTEAPAKRTGNKPETPSARPEITTEKPPAEAASAEETPDEEVPTTPPADVQALTGPVTAIGDSVMLGSIAELQKPIGNLPIIDAEVGLQVATAIDILWQRRAAGQLGEVVIVHLGNNGTFTAEQFDEMMKALEGRRVIFVNLKVPRTWEGPNNQVLADGVKRYDNTTLVDWNSTSLYHPEYFWDDGMHLRPEGAKVYADLISAQLRAP